jgi:hypothetical protein
MWGMIYELHEVVKHVRGSLECEHFFPSCFMVETPKTHWLFGHKVSKQSASKINNRMAGA